MRKRALVLAGSWLCGSALSMGVAWSTVSRVDSPLVRSAESRLSDSQVAAAVAIAATAGTAPAPVIASPEPGLSLPESTTSAEKPVEQPPLNTANPAVTTTSSAAPRGTPTTQPSETDPPQSSSTASASVPTTTKAPSATTAAPGEPTVVTSTGGSAGVSCAADSHLTIVWASPKPGYRYVIDEIERTTAKISFRSETRRSDIEIECNGIRPKVHADGR